MNVDNGGQRGRPPYIFIHDTDIADRDLIVLFFGLFSYFSVLAIFSVFFPIFRSFFRLPPPPWKFFCRRPFSSYFKISV